MELYLMPRKRVKYSNGGSILSTSTNIWDAEIDAQLGLGRGGKPVGSVGVQVPSSGLRSEVYGGLGGPQHVTTSVQDTPVIGGTTVSRVDLPRNGMPTRWGISNYRNIGDLAQVETYVGSDADSLRGQFGVEANIPLDKAADAFRGLFRRR